MPRARPQVIRILNEEARAHELLARGKVLGRCAADCARVDALARSVLASDLRADGRGSQSRERARLTNEMRLIGISRLDCDVGRSRWLRCARQTQETLKSQNAIKCLRPVAEILAAASE